MKDWKSIPEFDNYSVSRWGDVRHEFNGRIMIVSQNQSGLAMVSFNRNARQYRRSLPLLVAQAFLPRTKPPFTIPINKDGDRMNCAADNLVYRPRWYAVRYNAQFRRQYSEPILDPVRNVDTGDTFRSSWDASIAYGVLEEDLVLSIENATYVWPTYHRFEVLY